MAVRMPKKIHVLMPPPTLKVKYSGMPPSRANRMLLLKLSLPGPSAGRGAFLMVGYCLGQRWTGFGQPMAREGGWVVLTLVVRTP